MLPSKETYKYLTNANILFTSPPYINVFNYHQNYRAIIEALGWDVLKIAQSEFGSNRKNRGNRFKTVVDYSLDMEVAIKGWWKTLAPNGIIILVIGRESKIRDVAFYNGKIVNDIFNAIGGFEHLSSFERVFQNKFGESIVEDILVYKKCDVKPTLDITAKAIAVKHIEKAILTTNDVVKIEEMLDVINKIDFINPSPIFSIKGE